MGKLSLATRWILSNLPCTTLRADEPPITITKPHTVRHWGEEQGKEEEEVFPFPGSFVLGAPSSFLTDCHISLSAISALVDSRVKPPPRRGQQVCKLTARGSHAARALEGPPKQSPRTDDGGQEIIAKRERARAAQAGLRELPLAMVQCPDLKRNPFWQSTVHTTISFQA